MLAASQSFGTGTALALGFPLLVLLLRPAALRAPRVAVALWAVPVLVLAAMAVMYHRQTRLNPNPELWRFFLVCATFGGLVASMLMHLFALGVSTLLLGAAYPLDRYPDSLAVVSTIVFVVAVVWAIWVSPPRGRAVLVAFLAIALACYASVAAPRAVPFGIMRPKDLLAAYAAATRYHYLAQTALTALVCLVLATAATRVRWSERTKTALFGLWLVTATAANVLFGAPIDHYDTVRERLAEARARTTAEVAAAPEGSTVCVENRPIQLAGGFPGSVGVFVLYHPDDRLDGRRVRFVTSDAGLLDRVQGRVRTLLFRAGTCPEPSAGGRG
jgi:hypothetical protein